MISAGAQPPDVEALASARERSVLHSEGVRTLSSVKARQGVYRRRGVVEKSMRVSFGLGLFLGDERKAGGMGTVSDV